MLSLRSINQFYGQNHILWDVDLELSPGTCTGVVGRAGMGKTTLVNCIMGHLPINSGSMIWQEKNLPPQDLLLLPAEKRAALGIGYVPQGRHLFSQLTVEENLQVALIAGSAHAAHPVIPQMIYDVFPALYSRRHQRSGELPLHQQQQLAFARALVLKPKLLILDRPTEGVPPWLEEDMCQLIRQLNHDFGMTILLFEQRLSLIRRVADYFLLLHRGRSVAKGHMALLDEKMVDTWLAA